jgi:pimeloyl-ACP methyl ester carboxylesterase
MKIWGVAKLVTFAAAICCGAVQALSAQASLERTELVRAGSATIRVTVRGQGEPVVFIPSLARGVEDFEDLSRRVAAAGFQATLPDPRGIGGSTGPLDGITLHHLAADIAAVLETLGGKPAVLVGHGLGNRIARMVASDHPMLTKSVVLLAAGGLVPETPEVLEVEMRAFDATIPRGERLAAMRQTFFASGNDAKSWEDGWYLHVAPAQFAIMRRQPREEWWAGGSAPILVLQATEDVQAVPENSRRFAAEFPDRVNVVDIPNAGHAMLPEQPERIAAAIIAHLKR